MLRRVCLVLLLSLCALAHASPMPCGVYTTPGSAEQFVVVGAGHVRVIDGKQTVSQYGVLEQQGKQWLFVTSEGLEYSLQISGKQLIQRNEFSNTRFTRREAGRCTAPVAPAACAGKTLVQCLAQNQRESNLALCAYGIDAACQQQFEQEFPSDGLAAFYEQNALSDRAMARLGELCQAAVAGETCARYAKAAVLRKEFALAHETLGRQCGFFYDDSCEAFLALDTLGDKLNLPAQPASALPCGKFTALNPALVDELDFVDAGQVHTNWGSTLPARIEHGDIRLRHDKGGDFVLHALDADTLIGIDSWLSFTVYQRAGGQTSCTPPLVIRQQPLPSDCPSGNAQRCCAQGKLQGCLRAGHLAALSGQWQQAHEFYQPLCAAGIREGCENLQQLRELEMSSLLESRLENEQPESALPPSSLPPLRPLLAQWCANDAQHVACEILLSLPQDDEATQ